MDQNDEEFPIILPEFPDSNQMTPFEDFVKTSETFQNEQNLKEAINEISNKKGFKVIKNHGKKDDLVLMYDCEFGGKPRESNSQGLRKKKQKNKYFF